MAEVAAGLHDNHGDRMVCHARHELRTRQFLEKLDLSGHRRTVKLKSILCQIHPDHWIFYIVVLSALSFLG
jgi:hypothetical protein